MKENAQMRLNRRLSTAGSKIYGRLSDAEERLDKNSRVNLALIAVVCVVAFSMALFFNMSTHLAADDYAYNFIFLEDGAEEASGFLTGERITCIGDIFESMKAHYNTVNGRVVEHFFVQLMMLAGKSVFNFINSAMLVLLIFLIYLHCKGRSKNHSVVMFCMAALAVWTFVPGVGVTVFWLDGSVNYMWGSVIRLAALLPFRMYYDSGKIAKQAPMCLLMTVISFLAGATNENTSAAFIVLAVLYMAIFRFIKGIKLPLWGFASVIGGICGYVFMVFAPATFIRMNDMGGGSKLRSVAIILSNIVARFSPYVAAFVIVALVLYFTVKEKAKLNLILPACYMVAAVVGAAVMIISPYFPDRAWFGMYITAVISVGMLVCQLKLSERFVRQCVTVAAVCWMAWGSVSFARTAYDARLVDAQFDAREAYIEQQKEQGNYDITVRLIVPEEERSPHYGVADLSDDPENRRNTDMAKYYGLNSIVAGENDEY